MKIEDVIFSLIKKENETRGMVYESKIMKMATLLNIHPDTYEKIKERLIENGKIGKSGLKLLLL
jgi:hypothetical protein